MCASCTTKQKRMQRYSRADRTSTVAGIIAFDEREIQKQANKKRKTGAGAGAGAGEQMEAEGEGEKKAKEGGEEEMAEEEELRHSDQLRCRPELRFYVNNGSSATTVHGTRVGEPTTGAARADQDGDNRDDNYESEVEVTTPWKFKCKCGISCSSDDDPPYYPDGNTFECSECGLWCHVACVLGPTVTAEDLEVMENVKCISCARKGKKPRKRELHVETHATMTLTATATATQATGAEAVENIADGKKERM